MLCIGESPTSSQREGVQCSLLASVQQFLLRYRYRCCFLTQLVVHRWCHHHHLLPSQTQVGGADCSRSLSPQNYCQTLLISLSYCSGHLIVIVKIQAQYGIWKLISVKTLVARMPSWIWFAHSVFVSVLKWDSFWIELKWDSFWIERKECYYRWTFHQDIETIGSITSHFVSLNFDNEHAPCYTRYGAYTKHKSTS